MKYHIGKFILDQTSRTLSAQDSCQSIRPKTLALLIYLAERSGEIISKQELLDNIWDDVTVDEGVIFQSVREVRQLFSDPHVIQNHPRRGYQLTAEVSRIEESQKTPFKFLPFLKFFVPALLVLGIAIFATMHYEDSSEPVQYDERIIVLPIKNQVQFKKLDWLYLGGMEQFIAKLKGLPDSIFVYPGTHVPHLMHMASMERLYTSDHVSKVFDVSGASLVVETDLYGGANEYRLVYKFHVPNDVKQGVILDTSIDSALTSLSEKLAAFINHPLKRTEDLPFEEFSNALFAEAIIHYESDWETSISFFESYLSLNPESVIALLYLSKLYIWSDKVDEAESLLSNATVFSKGDPQELAEILLERGKVAAKRKDWKGATQLYKKAATAIKGHSDWLLKARIAEEQGLVYLEQKLLVEATEAFDTALQHYRIIQSPIGISHSQLLLAHALFLQGKLSDATKVYQQAKANIQSKNLDFLYSALQEYESKFDEFLAEPSG